MTYLCRHSNASAERRASVPEKSIAPVPEPGYLPLYLRAAGAPGPPPTQEWGAAAPAQ